MDCMCDQSVMGNNENYYNHDLVYGTRTIQTNFLSGQQYMKLPPTVNKYIFYWNVTRLTSGVFVLFIWIINIFFLT